MKQLTGEAIFQKIQKKISDFDNFEKLIITHIKVNHFPLIYQSIYEQIKPPFSTGVFKELLKNNYLKLLNDIYKTRLSKKAFKIIFIRLDEVDDFNNYENVLRIFSKCNFSENNRRNPDKNAYSLGTKVLHTFNPEENPILDEVVRKNLKLGNNIDIELCLNFRYAMNKFVENYQDYFSMNRLKRNSAVFREFNLKIEFPKMKLLDMALYKK